MSTDPRSLGGDIAGPGGPHDLDGVTVDTRNAVLLDHTTVATLKLNASAPSGEPVDLTWLGAPAVALLMEGRINQTQDRARVLFLMNEDGASALIVEILGLLERMPEEAQVTFLAAIEERLGMLP